MPGRREVRALLAGVLLLARGGVPAAGEAPLRVEYREDRLSVRAEQVPIGAVIDEVARQTGAEVVGQPREDRPVTAEFESVPMADGLKRLLGVQNFILRYGEGEKLRRIELLGGPQTVRAAVAPATPTTVPPAAPSSPQDLMTLLGQQPPVPVAGRLAQTLGASTATLLQLLDAMLHQEDPGVRAEALRAWLNGVESNGELKTAAISWVGSMDDGTLGTLFRNAAGAHAEELAALLAAQARAPEIRTRAVAILQQLRATRTAKPLG